jgi:hypothetical protein
MHPGRPNHVAWAFNFGAASAAHSEGAVAETRPRVNGLVLGSVMDYEAVRPYASYLPDTTSRFFEI